MADIRTRVIDIPQSRKSLTAMPRHTASAQRVVQGAGAWSSWNIMSLSSVAMLVYNKCSSLCLFSNVY